MTHVELTLTQAEAATLHIALENLDVEEHTGFDANERAVYRAVVAKLKAARLAAFRAGA